MDTLYTLAAIVGGTLLVCQFFLMLLGVAGAEFHEDVSAGDYGDGEPNGPNLSSGWFTLRGISAAATFFGLVGLAGTAGGWNPLTAGATATAAGIGGLILVGLAFYILHGFRASGTLQLTSAIGCRGTVYLTIPGQRCGAGKIHVTVQKRLVELPAVTSGPTLPNGTDVVILGLVNSDTVEVTVAPKS